MSRKRQLVSDMRALVCQIVSVAQKRPSLNQPDAVAEWCIDMKNAAEWIAEIADDAEQEYRSECNLPEGLLAEELRELEADRDQEQRDGWMRKGLP